MTRVTPMNKGREVLVIGADLVMPKLFYFGEELSKLGYSYAIYTHDVTCESNAVAQRAGVRLIAGPSHRKSVSRMLKDIFRLTKTVRQRDFHHAELYSDYHIFASFCYLLVLWIKQIPVVLWCRGELYNWPEFRGWQKLYFRVAMGIAKLVVLKETYMVSTLTAAGIYRPEKSIELHNSVPFDAWRRTRKLDPACLRLLYLNSFKAWRNVRFCVEVAAVLRERGISFHMTIVGHKVTSPGLEDECDALRNDIKRLALEECVTIEDFSDDPRAFYASHDIFLLPANLIFCNYALLEAMRDGMVPVVNNLDGDYQRIVEDGVSGFGCPLDARLWVDKIELMVGDAARFAAMSAAAEARIRANFSTGHLFDLYARRSELKPE